jgi:Holliday junction resolvasome RuvABC endonuclease subunit
VLLGIDPGFRFAGFSVFKKELGSSLFLLECGVLKLKPTDSLSSRIGQFYRHFNTLIDKWHITPLA